MLDLLLFVFYCLVVINIIGLLLLTREDLFGNGGSKGITNEYTSKSGMKRTAKKSREDHIV